MVVSKKKRRVLAKETRSESYSLTLRTLISSIQSPQGLNTANLKKLYAMLLHLSLNCFNCEYGYMELDKCDLQSKFKDLCDLSDVLFKELDIRFKEIFFALHNFSASSVKNIWANSEEVMLMLRCCMVVMLVLIAFNQELLVTKCKLLLSILSRLISFESSGGGGACEIERSSTTFKRFVSVECLSGDCTASVTEEFVASESSDSYYGIVCALLEVFADELLVHKSLRKFFMLIDSASGRNEMLFNFHLGHGNIGSVLEVVCAHFVLSVSGEQAFAYFIEGLFWCHRKLFRIPEISLPAALSLLLNPVVLSAPKLFQTYIILLVSEVIGICKVPENAMLDVPLMDWYANAFERSAILYIRHVSSFCADDHLADNGSLIKSGLHGNGPLNFESFLLKASMDKLNHLTAKFKGSWDSGVSKMPCRTNSDLVASSISYVKENICNFEKSCREEILSILNCIILKCSSDDTSDTLFQKDQTSAQDIYVLASMLKLMSSSMLQIIWYLKCVQFSGCWKSSRDLCSCKEYNSIVCVLGYFERFGINLPVQNFLHEKMLSHPERHKESKWMLLHLSFMLSFSYARGIDFLVKGCLFTLMTLLNFFIVEEGDLSALGALHCSGSEPYPSESSDGVEKVLVVKKSSQVISLKFQKIQDIYFRTQSLMVPDKRKQVKQSETLEYSSVLSGLDSSITIANNTEEICNGEMFLKCILGKSWKKSDFDELADFIECKSGKDYSGWLKGRERFRQWKSKKMLKLRWKKKKLTWNSMK